MPPPLPNELAPDPPTDPGRDSPRREEARLLIKLGQYRQLQATLGTQPTPPGLDGQALAQWLLYEQLSTLTECKILLSDACEVVIAHTEDMRHRNLVKERELRIREAEELRLREREHRRWSLFSGGATALLDLFRKVMLDRATIAVFVTAIVSAITWLVGRYFGT